MGLSGLIIAAYGMGLALSLKTRREIFSGADRGKAGESAVAVGFGLARLAGVTVLVAMTVRPVKTTLTARKLLRSIWSLR